MQSTSSIVNKSFRKIISPELRHSGFEKIDARNGWRWNEKTIWVFTIRSVGYYFSSVTGWPSGSVGVNIGIFYTFMPIFPEIKKDNNRRLTPKEPMCQMRCFLECKIDQKEKVSTLNNPADRQQKDIWWVEPDGSNSDEISIDIRRALLDKGIPWFTRLSNLEETLGIIEESHDCYNKYAMAYFISKEISDNKKAAKYFLLAEKEGERIGHGTDPKKWYVFGG